MVKRIEQGQSITSEDIRKHDGGLLINIYRKFDNWQSLLDEVEKHVEVPHYKMRNYNNNKGKEKLKQQLVDDFIKEYPGKAYISRRKAEKEWSKNNVLKLSSFYGGWSPFLESVGKNKSSAQHLNYTKEDVQKELTNRYKFGKSLSVKDLPKALYNAINLHYPDYQTALNTSNINFKEARWKDKKEMILTEIKSRYTEGKSLYREDLRKENKQLYDHIRYYFGTQWHIPMEQAGIPKNYYKPKTKTPLTWTKEEEEMVMNFSVKEVVEKYPYRTYGSVYSRKRKLEKEQELENESEDIKKEKQSFIDQVNDTFPGKEYITLPKVQEKLDINYAYIQRYFINWTNFLKAAGRKYQRGVYTKKEIDVFLKERVSQGKSVKSKDLAKENRRLLQELRKQYGNLTTALEANHIKSNYKKL